MVKCLGFKTSAGTEGRALQDKKVNLANRKQVQDTQMKLSMTAWYRLISTLLKLSLRSEISSLNRTLGKKADDQKNDLEEEKIGELNNIYLNKLVAALDRDVPDDIRKTRVDQATLPVDPRHKMSCLPPVFLPDLTCSGVSPPPPHRGKTTCLWAPGLQGVTRYLLTTTWRPPTWPGTRLLSRWVKMWAGNILAKNK